LALIANKFSIANSTIGRRSLVKMCGLLLSFWRHCKASLCSEKLTKAYPFERALPLESNFEVSFQMRHSVICANFPAASTHISLSFPSVMEEGRLCTIRRVGDMNICKFSNFLLDDSANRCRFLASSELIPFAAEVPSRINENRTRRKFLLSSGTCKHLLHRCTEKNKHK
uniref:Secreted protein n=1 Tax=Haemonchus placei TaxID=6290 RepID=A0A0N4WPB3_HAEPC